MWSGRQRRTLAQGASVRRHTWVHRIRDIAVGLPIPRKTGARGNVPACGRRRFSHMAKEDGAIADVPLPAPEAHKGQGGLPERSDSRRFDLSRLRARSGVESAAHSAEAGRPTWPLQQTHVATAAREPRGLQPPARLTVDPDRLFFTMASGVVWSLPRPIAQTFRPFLVTNLAIPRTADADGAGAPTVEIQPGVQQGSPTSTLLFTWHMTREPRVRTAAPAAEARRRARAVGQTARTVRRA